MMSLEVRFVSVFRYNLTRLTFIPPDMPVVNDHTGDDGRDVDSDDDEYVSLS